MFATTTHETRKDRAARKRLGSWTTPEARALWTMKDKRKIKLREMGDTHLENTLKMLARVAAVKQAKEDALFLMGPLPNGEMATMAFDDAAAEQASMSWADYVPDIFWTMVSEYELRGYDMDDIRAYGNGRSTAMLAAILKRALE